MPYSFMNSTTRLAPVIPVLVIDDVATARPLAEALVKGGLPVLEVTLRTPVALDVIHEMAKVEGGTAPILAEGIQVYSNPLPHVLILTAIVVGVATTALGLALVVRIRDAYGTIEDDDIEAQENGIDH